MFRRRIPLSFFRKIREMLWPRGGWRRAASYVAHRLRRLPDRPHKIARGIGAGIFVCFTPFYGFHFVMALLVSFLIRGNLLAALLATFIGNPLTFPLIAALSIELGNIMLGEPNRLPVRDIFKAFSGASYDLWYNVAAIFTEREAHWEGIRRFFDRVFLPYLVGGIIPGILAGVASFALSRRVIEAYQKRRRKKLHERFVAMRAKIVAEAAQAEEAGEE